MRSVDWEDNTKQVVMIDQRLLPGVFQLNHYSDYVQIADAIKDMVVRGAPAIGISGAFGMVLAGYSSKSSDQNDFKKDLIRAGEILKSSRPTAVNLSWAVDRILEKVINIDSPIGELQNFIKNEAITIADEDVEINKKMSEFGANLIVDGDVIIHHCNTGSLATGDWGTALGVIHMAHIQGKDIHVLVDETRPRLQGSRLTAWELERYGISYEIITDNAAGYFLQQGDIDLVLFGADRVAANGDVVNKIGTYMLALSAMDNKVPAYAVVPLSTIDLNSPSGKDIEIEERDPEEVLSLSFSGRPTFPEGARARNPAFDRTPNHLIVGIVTEKGILYPPFEESINHVLSGSI